MPLHFGYLLVPEDRSQGSSGDPAQTIRLHVAIFPSPACLGDLQGLRFERP